MSVQYLLKTLLDHALNEVESAPSINWFGETPNKADGVTIEQADRVESDRRLIRGLGERSILGKIAADYPKTIEQLDAYHDFFSSFETLDIDGYSAAVEASDKEKILTMMAANQAMRTETKIPNDLCDVLTNDKHENTNAFKIKKPAQTKIENYPVESADCRIIETGRQRELGERLALVRTEDKNAPIYEALHHAYHIKTSGKDDPEPLNIIILTKEDRTAKWPWRVDIHAEAKWRHLLQQAMHRKSRRKHKLLETRAWMKGRGELHLRIESLDGKGASALSDFVNFLLREMVVGARPLLGWRANFLQPMRMSCEDVTASCLSDIPAALNKLRTELLEHKDWEVEKLDEEAKAYLLPHVRKHYYAFDNQERGREQHDKTLTLIYRPIDMSLTIQPGMGGKERYEKSFKCEIKALRLHFFHFDVIALEWELGETVDVDQLNKKTTHKGEWKDYFDSKKLITKLCLAQVMDIMATGRFIFSTAEAEESNGEAKKTKICLIKTDKKNSQNSETKEKEEKEGCLIHLGGVTADAHMPQTWLRSLLEELLPDEHHTCIDQMRIVGDDRARVCASIVMAGAQSVEGDDIRSLLARLHMMEEWGQGWPYDATFSADELKRGYYTRYASLGSHYVVSDHAFCFLGFGNFPLKIVHNNHMKNIYRPLFWLMPFYSAIVDSLSVRIHQNLSGRADGATGFSRLKKRLTRFRATLLYDRVSSQVQGRDLFDLMRRSAPAPKEIKVMESQISDMESFYADQRERGAENRIRFLTSAGVPLVLFATMQTLFALPLPLPLSWLLFLEQWQISLSAVLTVAGWWALYCVNILKHPESRSGNHYPYRRRHGFGILKQPKSRSGNLCKNRLRTGLFYTPVGIVLALGLWSVMTRVLT